MNAEEKHNLFPHHKESDSSPPLEKCDRQQATASSPPYPKLEVKMQLPVEDIPAVSVPTKESAMDLGVYPQHSFSCHKKIVRIVESKVRHPLKILISKPYMRTIRFVTSTSKRHGTPGLEEIDKVSQRIGRLDVS